MILLSGGFYGTLHIWSIKTYQSISIIDITKCIYNNCFYQIDKDRIIVGGIDTITIINVDKFMVEKIIKDEIIGSVRSFLKLKDNNTILCGSGYSDGGNLLNLI